MGERKIKVLCQSSEDDCVSKQIVGIVHNTSEDYLSKQVVGVIGIICSFMGQSCHVSFACSSAKLKKMAYLPCCSPAACIFWTYKQPPSAITYLTKEVITTTLNFVETTKEIIVKTIKQPLKTPFPYRRLRPLVLSVPTCDAETASDLSRYVQDEPRLCAQVTKLDIHLQNQYGALQSIGSTFRFFKSLHTLELDGGYAERLAPPYVYQIPSLKTLIVPSLLVDAEVWQYLSIYNSQLEKLSCSGIGTQFDPYGQIPRLTTATTAIITTTTTELPMLQFLEHIICALPQNSDLVWLSRAARSLKIACFSGNVHYTTETDQLAVASPDFKCFPKLESLDLGNYRFNIAQLGGRTLAEKKLFQEIGSLPLLSLTVYIEYLCPATYPVNATNYSTLTSLALECRTGYSHKFNPIQFPNLPQLRSLSFLNCDDDRYSWGSRSPGHSLPNLEFLSWAASDDGAYHMLPESIADDRMFPVSRETKKTKIETHFKYVTPYFLSFEFSTTDPGPLNDPVGLTMKYSGDWHGCQKRNAGKKGPELANRINAIVHGSGDHNIDILSVFRVTGERLLFVNVKEMKTKKLFVVSTAVY